MPRYREEQRRLGARRGDLPNIFEIAIPKTDRAVESGNREHRSVRGPRQHVRVVGLDTGNWRPIVDPPAFAVDGYSGDTMPGNYGDQLTPEEIDTLVEYLLGLSQTEEGN